MPTPPRLLLVVAALLVPSASVSAQVLGTFPWQMQPYCNRVTLTLSQSPAGFVLEGLDDQCGTSNRASALGMASFNASGNMTMNFSIVTAPGARAVHVSAVVSTGSGSGAWSDSVGNTGAFVFLGNTPGLPPRPLPSSGLPAGVITTTELAANTVTGAKVADGSLTTVDLLDAPRLAGNGGNVSVTLTAVPAIVRSATITAPTAGKVLALATGYFKFIDTSTVEEAARCSLNTAVALTAFDSIVVSDARSTSANSYASLAVMRTFTVAPGPLTIYLVCDRASGAPEVGNANIALMFSAQ